jgi:hypothetical protein
MSKVQYSAGPSRHGEKGVDYMLVVVPTEGEDIELYAEMESIDAETATYDVLKASILEQAAEKGIDADKLKFWYD